MAVTPINPPEEKIINGKKWFRYPGDETWQLVKETK